MGGDENESCWEEEMWVCMDLCTGVLHDCPIDRSSSGKWNQSRYCCCQYSSAREVEERVMELHIEILNLPDEMSNEYW